MPRPIRPWFRFYVEAFSDRKLRRLKPAQRWVWVAVLGAARESHIPGELYVAPGLPMTIAELADYAAVTERETKAAVDVMIALSMVEKRGELLVVTNWGKRQFESDNITERTRDYRSKHPDGNDVGTFQPRSQERPNGGGRNTPERGRAFATETETEAEAETEGGGAPKRAHQLPTDFEPNDTNRRIAEERGLDLAAVIEQFSDYHRANGKTMKDWHLALNTWLRREKVNPAKATAPPKVSVAEDFESAPTGLTDQEWFDWDTDRRRRADEARRAAS